MVITMVQILSLYIIPFVGYIRFSKCLLFIFLIFIVQIDLYVTVTL